MAPKARNTNDPKYSKLAIGVCPDQWGVWFPDDPKQIAPRQAMQEMAEAGFEILETGPYGYFPTDPKELTRWTDEFGLKVVAGTGWGVLHKAEAWPTTVETFRKIAETHAAVGAEYIVHLPPLYRDDKTWEWTDDRVLSDDAWKLFIENANKLGQMLLDEYGLKMVLHPHGDSHIETPEEIARIFDATDPTYVNLCLDTGHVVYGGGDPIELIKQYPERITYVHIKAFDPEITREAHEKDWPFGEAVAKGASVRPPAGEPDMKKLVNALSELDKDIYVVCEQDLYPCDPGLPKPNAIATREYLAECGLGLK
ncbi:sugar phosphate isomerase/epimerase family protein [Acidipropionibacterium jensenii]|uniref:2-keto-myo-inositol dehydratase n=1 Tax=Acidipropionibacterium jensenii TaxID=1749 RepID=A0A3Q9UEI1_9ACTN|nr:TIM barrel protein [Acidipropionibacterium jensenii]AZZ40051.1 2-keto-myo-inositol dehydratase [Acidipropionibacterium jensenii]MDN5977969.1 sugar phosphate isomerase/epimerase [Acidipropionibacterium jensenii]MDN5995742.1 sugar phosphate isomerase/epimerase [Acidipropionibacterium jensenii]MDN6426623.1 sugar phosphate isomerase/epimerase [Acidipropionibacterium jensenii]MDN6440788.1 sugar phosphate isomerase/epimerase [Acidipropionibacterium jensenii]